MSIVITRKYVVVGDVLQEIKGWERYKVIVTAIAIAHYRTLSYIV